MTKAAGLPLSTVCRAVLWLLAMTSSCRGVTLIDLSHQLRTGQSLTWPVNPELNFTILSRGHNAVYNVWLEYNKFAMPEHMGTHVDAPAHFTKGGLRMHQIPVDKLSGPGVVVDVKQKVMKDAMYQVTLQDLKDWESEHGEIPERAVVLMNTGWASRYPDRLRVFNTDNLKDLNSFKYPSVSPEAARWLMEERTINAVGMDTPSPDTGRNSRFPVHEILLPNNILILENVANLNSLPAKGSTIVIGALKLYDGSGAPMRLLAFSAGWRLQGGSLPFLCLILITLLLR